MTICDECNFPLDEFGDCTNSACPSLLEDDTEWHDGIENNVDDLYETYDEDDENEDEEELTID
jgi:hypothetical protein